MGSKMDNKTFLLVGIIVVLLGIGIFGWFRFNPPRCQEQVQVLEYRQLVLDTLLIESRHRTDSLLQVVQLQSNNLMYQDSINKRNKNELIRIKTELKGMLAGVDTLDIGELYSIFSDKTGVW